MSEIVKIDMDEKCAEIVYTYILNEFSWNLKMLEDVIKTVTYNIERLIRQLPFVEDNADEIYTKARELGTKLADVVKEYMKDNKDDKLRHFVVFLAVASFACSTLEIEAFKVASVVEHILRGVVDDDVQ